MKEIGGTVFASFGEVAYVGGNCRNSFTDARRPATQQPGRAQPENRQGHRLGAERCPVYLPRLDGRKRNRGSRWLHSQRRWARQRLCRCSPRTVTTRPTHNVDAHGVRRHLMSAVTERRVQARRGSCIVAVAVVAAMFASAVSSASTLSIVTNPTWSPDGTRGGVRVQRHRDVPDRDGARVRRRADSHGVLREERGRLLRPDALEPGRRILFDSNFTLMSVSPNGGKPTALATGHLVGSSSRRTVRRPPSTAREAIRPPRSAW